MNKNFFPLLGTLVLLVGAARGATAAPLWQIGQVDTNNAEFALAPNGSAQFRADGLFVVGTSDAKRDWPFVQPGPFDSWAGSRPHTFSILFALKKTVPDGSATLRLVLLDTHKSGPPHLRVEVNGQTYDRELPPGNGDESIGGAPAKGRHQTVDISFPASLLRVGDNEIHLMTTGGSWLLYDAVELVAPDGVELTPSGARTVVTGVEPIRALREVDGKLFQPVRATVRQFGGEVAGRMRIGEGAWVTNTFKDGDTRVELLVPAGAEESRQTFIVEKFEGGLLATRTVTLKPVPKLTVYVLPHSHTDIGYTEIQTAVETRQVNNLVEGMAAARATAGNPPGARFVWNVEVLWAADLYLQRLSAEQKAEFIAAVKRGEVVLNGAYLNELTGLCRPEELLRLFRDAPELAALTGVPIDSVMISDVPGYTAGMVTAMAQAGIRYFSTAPNYFDRIGTILRAWENKPFYWVAPDGQSKVLVWIPFWGYALSHRHGRMTPRLVDELCDSLQTQKYPYEIAYLRWSGHGDNATPDPEICAFIKDWNTTYAWPKFIISGTGEAFRALEQRYGDQLPRVQGDWTPFWEDGAGSSALETALNRASSDRVTQAETLQALVNPQGYSAELFHSAWRHVLLYSEHTWGADCSISQPESQKTREQWDIKQGYAQAADRESRQLLAGALAGRAGAVKPASVDVFNTLSWSRSELVTLTPEQSSAGDRVTDATRRTVSSQRLSSGELVFFATDLPPFAAQRFSVTAGAAPAPAKPATVQGAVLDNGLVRVRVNERTGGIVELTAAGVPGNFADPASGEGLNDYMYLPGDDLTGVQRNGPVTLRVGEPGPLVASLIIESSAPGCKRLRRELRLVAGQDHVELINLVDKERLQAESYHARNGKESVNFAFAFNVPDGAMLLDIPFGTLNPENGQIPGSCKNWFTVGRWVEVANAERGITWVTLDAPLIQIGGLTANLLNSQTDPDVWRKSVSRTQKFYSWAMNNHWGTNYRAYQEGPTIFRYVLRPHRGTQPAENTRFATAFSHPLLATPARGDAPVATPRLRLDSPDVLVTGMKPSEDGKALIVRLFGAAGKAAEVTLAWGGAPPKSVWLSNTGEAALQPLAGKIPVPAWGVVTVRAERE